MFISLMLVGYATSKFNNRPASNMSWQARLFGRKEPVSRSTPTHDDASWNLGAEAWVTLPAQPSEVAGVT